MNLQHKNNLQHKKQAEVSRDLYLERAKRTYQEAGLQAVKQGQISDQSMHLFGRALATKVNVEFRDVDFD